MLARLDSRRGALSTQTRLSEPLFGLAWVACLEGSSHQAGTMRTWSSRALVRSLASGADGTLGFSPVGFRDRAPVWHGLGHTPAAAAAVAAAVLGSREVVEAPRPGCRQRESRWRLQRAVGERPTRAAGA